jgi:hypothetical protein
LMTVYKQDFDDHKELRRKYQKQSEEYE